MSFDMNNIWYHVGWQPLIYHSHQRPLLCTKQIFRRFSCSITEPFNVQIDALSVSALVNSTFIAQCNNGPSNVIL